MSVLRYHLENVRGYLSNHWAVRLLVVPVLFLAGIVTAYAVVTGNSAGDVLAVSGGYLLFSLATVLAGLALEAIAGRLTDGSLLGP